MLGVKGTFGEDMQTYYGRGWTGARALWRIYNHTGRRPPHEHLPPSKWKSAKDESYRRCCTALAWVGEALAARRLGLVAHWRHDAFFDYVDRWMTEKDSPRILAAFKRGPMKRVGIKSGTVWDGWVKEAWRRYRGPIRPLYGSGKASRVRTSGSRRPR